MKFYQAVENIVKEQQQNRLNKLVAMNAPSIVTDKIQKTIDSKKCHKLVKNIKSYADTSCARYEVIEVDRNVITYLFITDTSINTNRAIVRFNKNEIKIEHLEHVSREEIV